jgi:hypothetical protein
MTLLQNVFEARVISKDIWPPWSPNLIHPDYYLWAAMNGAVYKDNPHTLLELKDAIVNYIRNIPPTELSHVCTNKIRCVDECQQAHGVIFNIYCNINMVKVFVLIYRASLNILIIYGRCTGTFISSCTSNLIKRFVSYHFNKIQWLSTKKSLCFMAELYLLFTNLFP